MAGCCRDRIIPWTKLDRNSSASRERLNLRYRDVEEASHRIADRHKNDEFSIALSRLADIENKGTPHRSAASIPYAQSIGSTS